MKQRWFGMIAMAACLWLALSPLAQAAGRLTLPSALTSIDEEAFEYVAADELVVPANCASIGAGAFAHSKLRRAYLPSTVTFIGTGAFEDCDSLTCVVEPDSYALSWCAENGVPYEVLESIPAVPVGSIELSNRFIVLGPGETFTAHAAVLPADATIPALQWTIADESVATVDGEGGITAVDEGETTLTASATDGSGAFASCSVRVCPHAEYRALLVGERNFYTDDGDVWGTVPRNAGDTGLMRDMLTSVSAPDGGRYTGRITVAIDLSKAEIHAAIGEAFADAGEDDVSLFFIASHGDYTSTGAAAGRLTMSRGEGLQFDELAAWLSEVPGKVVVVVESCGAGAAIYLPEGEEDGDAGDGGVFAASEDPLADFTQRLVEAFAEIDPGVAAPEDVIFATPSESGTGALRVENKFYVLTAAAYQEQSWGATAYNYFTKWLTDGVGLSGVMPADTARYGGDDDGVATLYELYRYVSKVGDKKKFTQDGVNLYSQHVQVYPAAAEDSLPMFTR